SRSKRFPRWDRDIARVLAALAKPDRVVACCTCALRVRFRIAPWQETLVKIENLRNPRGPRNYLGRWLGPGRRASGERVAANRLCSQWAECSVPGQGGCDGSRES